MLRIPIHRRGKPRPSQFALVDDADYRVVSRFVWFLDGNGYVQRQEGGAKIYLHRQLLGLVPGDGVDVDHRNGDPLDNRRENLRPCTRAENNQNRRARGGTSRHRGVSFHSVSRRWQASCGVNGHLHFIGLFDTEADAAAAARRYRHEHLPFSVER